MVADGSGNIYAAVGGNSTTVFIVPTGGTAPSTQMALEPASVRLAVDGNNDVYALGQLSQQSSYVAKINAQQPPQAVIPPPVASEPPSYTKSYYQQAVSRTITQQQGCASRFRSEQGIVILDYGAPRERGSTTNPEYGTQLIQNPDSLDQVANFVSMTRIISAVQAFADGYYRVQRCPQFDRNDPDSINPVPAKLVIALGIHNGPTREDSTTRTALNADHGIAWSDMVVQLQQYMDQQRYSGIQVAGAYDAEPDWADLYTSRAATLDWARGFTAKNIVNGQPVATGVTYYNFGSLEGGYRTDEWITQTPADTRNMDFVYDLSRGFPGAQALPQIYNAAYAKEWYHLSYYSFTNKPTPLRIAGVLTECASSGCAANFAALQAQSWPLYKLDLLNTNGTILDFAPRQGWLALWDTLHRTQRSRMSPCLPTCG